MILNNENIIIALLSLPGIGKAFARKIVLQNKSIKDAEDILNIILKEKSLEKKHDLFNLDVIIKALNDAEKLILDSDSQDIKSIAFSSDDFPQTLNVIPNPPAIIYVKGNLSILSDINNVAVIGTRNNTKEAEIVGEIIVKKFVESKFNIVSGLAIGCDTIAHKSALKYHGKTIAVLAHGLEKVYPKENKLLADRILENNGCLISEYEIYTPSRPNFFVERDRIQSGLSKAVIVLQTALKGGTMHTVEFAQKQNKKIAAIQYKPNKIYNQIEGNIKLIEDKVAFALTFENSSSFIDIISERPIDKTEETSSKTLNSLDKSVLDEFKRLHEIFEKNSNDMSEDLKKDLRNKLIKIREWLTQDQSKINFKW